MKQNHDVNEKTLQSIIKLINNSFQTNEPLPKEVYKKLEKENIKLEGDEKKLFETIYRGAKELENQKLSPDELENIVGGSKLGDKLDNFMENHPKLTKALCILSIIESALIVCWAIGGIQIKMSKKP